MYFVDNQCFMILLIKMLIFFNLIDEVIIISKKEFKKFGIWNKVVYLHPLKNDLFTKLVENEKVTSV